MTQAFLDGDKATARGDQATGVWRLKALLPDNALRRIGAFILIALTLATGIATYSLFGDGTIEVDDSSTLLAVLYANMFLLLVFGVLVGRRVVKLWAERRRGLAGARLHARLVMLFGLVAITPAVLVSVFSLTFFDYGVREWFSTRVGTAIKSADAVANAYLEEHRQTIKGQILLIANDLNQYAQILSQDPKRMREMVRAQSVVRNLPEVVVFDQAGKVLARSPLSMTVEFDLFDAEFMDRAVAGEVVVIPAGADDKIRAMVRLNRLAGTYLLVGRYVDPDILAHVSETERA
ncbi:MAG: two-component sensor histidine kinase, partial [Thalassobaculaceae bacterium]